MSTLSSMVVETPSDALAQTLEGLWSNPSTDAAGRAQAIAQAWHQTTQSVLVTLAGLDTTPPPVGPLPITVTANVR
jgi:hypothetical protein